MKKLFDKTFFKFAFGFTGIIAVALFSLFAISAYGISNKDGVSVQKAPSSK